VLIPSTVSEDRQLLPFGTLRPNYSASLARPTPNRDNQGPRARRTAAAMAITKPKHATDIPVAHQSKCNTTKASASPRSA